MTGSTASRILQGAVTIWVLTLPLFPDDAHVPKVVLFLAAFAIILPVTGVFAHVFGEEIDHRRQTSVRRMAQIVLESLPIGLPALPPLFVFLLAWAGVLGLDVALLLSDLSLLSIVFAVGFLAGRSIGGLPRGLVDGLLAGTLALTLGLLRWLVI